MLVTKHSRRHAVTGLLPPLSGPARRRVPPLSPARCRARRLRGVARRARAQECALRLNSGCRGGRRGARGRRLSGEPSRRGSLHGAARLLGRWQWRSAAVTGAWQLGLVFLLPHSRAGRGGPCRRPGGARQLSESGVVAAAGDSRRVTASMMKFKPNQTRTYDREGYKKRAACLCFRSEREDEVSPPSCRARGAGGAGPGPARPGRGSRSAVTRWARCVPLSEWGAQAPRGGHPLHAQSRSGALLPRAASEPGEGAWSCADPCSLKREGGRSPHPPHPAPVWAMPGRVRRLRGAFSPTILGGAAGRGPTCAAAPSFVRGSGRRPSAGGPGCSSRGGIGHRLQLLGYPLCARDGQKVG